MNIILIGYRCSGKTSAGKRIAARAGMAFYDTDELIEKTAGQSIGKIVDNDGWERFREIEKAVIKNVSGLNDSVIATGGGVVLDEDNIKRLKKNGFIIWLEGDTDILMNRMRIDNNAGSKRPSLTGVDPVIETGKVLEIRNPLYGKAADLVINTNRLSPDEVAEKIMTAFRGRRSA